MNNILVEIYVPSIERSFDVYIPLTLKLHEIEGLVIGAITDLSGEYFAPSPDTFLTDSVSGTILDINMTALELNLRNGSKLMLI